MDWISLLKGRPQGIIVERMATKPFWFDLLSFLNLSSCHFHGHWKQARLEGRCGGWAWHHPVPWAGSSGEHLPCLCFLCVRRWYFSEIDTSVKRPGLLRVSISSGMEGSSAARQHCFLSWPALSRVASFCKHHGLLLFTATINFMSHFSICQRKPPS